MQYAGSIIKDLTSDDEKKQKEAVKASDNFMKNRPFQGNLKIKYDKCLINERKEFSGVKAQYNCFRFLSIMCNDLYKHEFLLITYVGTKQKRAIRYFFLCF